MSSKYSNKYPIPEKFPEILHNFSREVVRYMPKDILDFAIQYFYSLETSSPFNYISGGSKNIPITDLNNDNNNNDNKITKEELKEEIKEIEDKNLSNINTPQHSEYNQSRPDSEKSRGSGIVRSSKIFVNNIFENSKRKIRESMNIKPENYLEIINDNYYIENINEHSFSDISLNNEDKNIVINFVDNIFSDFKKNNISENN